MSEPGACERVQPDLSADLTFRLVNMSVGNCKETFTEVTEEGGNANTVWIECLSHC